MTDTTTSPAFPSGDPQLELGHPVRSFVVVLLLVGAALLGVRWGGVVHPQLTTSGSGFREAEAEGGREYHMVLLENDGLAPLRIEAIDWPTRGWTDVQFGVLPSGVGSEGPLPSPTTAGAATFEPFTLDGGFDEARWIVMSGRPSCPGGPISENVEVQVRTWIGVERTVSVAGPEAGSSDADVCP